MEIQLRIDECLPTFLLFPPQHGAMKLTYSSRPLVRDYLIENSDMWEQADWMHAIADSLDLAESFAPNQIYSRDQSAFRLLDSFKDYIGDPCHWVVGSEVGEMLPGIKGKVHFR